MEYRPQVVAAGRRLLLTGGAHCGLGLCSGLCLYFLAVLRTRKLLGCFYRYAISEVRNEFVWLQWLRFPAVVLSAILEPYLYIVSAIDAADTKQRMVVIPVLLSHPDLPT